MSCALIQQSFRPIVRNLTVQFRKASQEAQSARTRAVADEEIKQFWQKNVKLGRPWSPHLTIYKPQLTSMLSLVHRASGIAMALVWSSAGVGLGYYLGVQGGSFDDIFNYIKGLNLSPVTITGAKFVVLILPCYHYINGMRHLAWDRALGFNLKTTYRSGYVCSALAILVAGGIAMYRIK